MFQIERDIPIPPRAVRKSSSLYPFEDMQVGDSFLVPLNGAKVELVRGRIQNQLTRFRKADSAKKFSMRVIEGGIRVWRIE